MSDFNQAGFKVEYARNTTSKTSLMELSSNKVYSSIIADGEHTKPSDSNVYYFLRTITGIPCDGNSYYFKVATFADGDASFQENFKYYRIDTTTTTATVVEINAWEYQGSNATLTCDKMSSFSLYPDYFEEIANN